MNSLLLQYWGKAQPKPEPGDAAALVPWHPLVYHSLDVAAVGQVLLRANDRLGRLFDRLELDGADTEALFCFLLALHDLGKFSKPFQAKAPQFYPTFLGELPSLPDPGHSRASHLLWDSALSDVSETIANDAYAVHAMAVAVFGHHGAPVEPTIFSSAKVKRLFGRIAMAHARDFVETMRALFLKEGEPLQIQEDAAKSVSFPLAGFAVLCDWLGSSQAWFPYVAPGPSIEAYWQDYALPRAETAVVEAGVLPSKSSVAGGYEALFRQRHRTGKAFAPRPMQAWAERVALPDGPLLALIEDDTGSGKTEAAVMLAHRLMAAGRAAGFYVALPTMATANAMFDRMADVYANLFMPGTQPSCALAHGARALHPRFREMRLNAGRREPDYGGSASSIPAADEDVTASAACADWIADDRRRTFLADAGVGTVDQAILAILPSKFQSLRLLGLCQRVLILDEIHAYDAYVQQEIATLLELQASLGGSAVLLSATLPAEMRARYVAAFRKGLGERAGAVSKAPSSDHTTYPLATLVSSAGQQATPVTATRSRSLPVRFLATPDEALAEAAAAARAGCAVAYIRNTVDDVLAAAEALERQDVSALVFHARYALADRLVREREVLATFGRDSTSEQRRGKIVVASQVIEQSIDVDFDIMISDLAPVDLLIQRAGRLWRHERERPRGDCEFLVVAPSLAEEPDTDWYCRLFPFGASVYKDHARLWLTTKALQERGAINSPKGLRPLIEAVYGAEAAQDVPAALEDSLLDAEGKAKGDRSAAQYTVLNFSKGYVRDSGAWDSDIQTPTRLGDPMTTLRLARLEGGTIVPWADPPPEPDTPPWLTWRLSECQVRQYWIDGEAEWSAAVEPLVEAAKAGWSRVDESKVLVLLEQDEESGLWHGRCRSAEAPRRVSYSADAGLSIIRSVED